MQLDISCIRAILFTVEKYEHLNEPVSFDYEKNSIYNDFLSSYSTDQILYHVQYCIKVGFLSDICQQKGWGQICYECCLEPPGHDFLANIRSEQNWKQTKTIFAKVGGASLKVVSAIAEGVTTALANKYIPDEISKNIS